MALLLDMGRCVQILCLLKNVLVCDDRVMDVGRCGTALNRNVKGLRVNVTITMIRIKSTKDCQHF